MFGGLIGQKKTCVLFVSEYQYKANYDPYMNA